MYSKYQSTSWLFLSFFLLQRTPYGPPRPPALLSVSERISASLFLSLLSLSVSLSLSRIQARTQTGRAMRIDVRVLERERARERD